MLRARKTKKKAIRGAKFINFRCTDCGNCCSDTIVPITGQDVARLVKGEKFKAKSIVEFYKSDEFDDGGEGLHFVELDEGRKVMGLVKAWDSENERDACQYLKSNRCSVYSSRPVTCRVWPYTVRFSDKGEMTSLAINGTLHCPFELDGKGDGKKIASDWNWDDRQDDTWERTVNKWNKKYSGGTRAEFLKFLGVA